MSGKRDVYTDPNAVVAVPEDAVEDTEVKEIICSAEFECVDPEN